MILLSNSSEIISINLTKLALFKKKNLFIQFLNSIQYHQNLKKIVVEFADYFDPDKLIQLIL